MTSLNLILAALETAGVNACKVEGFGCLKVNFTKNAKISEALENAGFEKGQYEITKALVGGYYIKAIA